MTNATRKWIRGGLEMLIHGAAAAVTSTLSAAAIDNHDWGLFSPNFWKLATASFSANGGLRFFQWWATHPLPDDTNPPFPDQSQIQINPLAKVTSIPAPVNPPVDKQP